MHFFWSFFLFSFAGFIWKRLEATEFYLLFSFVATSRFDDCFFSIFPFRETGAILCRKGFEVSHCGDHRWGRWIGPPFARGKIVNKCAQLLDWSYIATGSLFFSFCLIRIYMPRESFPLWRMNRLHNHDADIKLRRWEQSETWKVFLLN